MANLFCLFYAILCYFVHCEQRDQNLVLRNQQDNYPNGNLGGKQIRDEQDYSFRNGQYYPSRSKKDYPIRNRQDYPFRNGQDYPFRNPDLPIEDRLEDLVSRLTLDEVIQQLAKGGASRAGPAPAIPRLGIQPYQWNTECLRGEPQSGNATAFPQALTLASSWNSTLLYRVAEATSIEVRAKHNHYVKHNDYGDHTGLSCFSPVINIMRDPLWGRNQETYGEDPYLTGVLAQNFVKGLHGTNTRYLRASSGCKHFGAHGGPEKNRFSFNAVISDRDWALTFQPAFKMCVEADTTSIMCSYNAINGVPACINKKLLTDTLRHELGFKGYVVSDEEAIENIKYFHRYLNDSVEIAARCLEAGTNLELSVGLPLMPIIYLKLKEAVNIGRLSPELLYERVKPLFLTRLRLGEFDPKDMNPYNALNLSQVLTKNHRELAKNAASQSYILLKNQGVLPIRSTVENLTIIGPMANNSEQLFGDYSPEPDPRFIVTPLQGLKKMARHVKYAAGCMDGTLCNDYDSSAISNAVRNSNSIIICLGTGQALEKETLDRQSLKLPGKQGQLLTDAMQSSSPIILLLFSSGPLDIENFMTDKIKAVFQCGFPAQATGAALYDTITMQTPQSNPAARLPYTWYRSTNNIPDIRNYSMQERTYRYLTQEPLFPFGFGLSYTTFHYSDLSLGQTILKIGQNLKIQVKVRNTGTWDGDEVIQVYLKWLNYQAMKMPQLQLVSFKRVHIKHGEEITTNFIVKSTQMAIWLPDGFKQVPGQMELFVGGQQPNQHTQVKSNVLQAQFKVVHGGNENDRFERL